LPGHNSQIAHAVSDLYVLFHRIRYGFGQFGLGKFQSFHLIYDFKHFCLILYVSQLKFCLKTQKYHVDILEDYLKLLEHLKQAVTEIMDIYIPCATKPKLHVMCPYCKEEVAPHIEFDHTAPVLCCRRRDRPEEIPRTRYIPCGIDVTDEIRKQEGKKYQTLY